MWPSWFTNAPDVVVVVLTVTVAVALSFLATEPDAPDVPPDMVELTSNVPVEFFTFNNFKVSLKFTTIAVITVDELSLPVTISPSEKLATVVSFKIKFCVKLTVGGEGYWSYPTPWFGTFTVSNLPTSEPNAMRDAFSPELEVTVILGKEL